ncbi:MAG: AAA family ATPase [Methylococcaceae bacterium]|nr:MAG: AAA family ATPase [Methylococcaceae bacterium]
MPYTFNTTGPSVPGQHYMLDPLARIDLPEVEYLIAQGKYFVLHAPRQTGKTTSLIALAKHLNARADYACVFCNVEAAQTARHDVARGVASVIASLASAAASQLGQAQLTLWRQELAASGEAPDKWLQLLLQRWAAVAGKPLVLLFDEIDALVGDTLVSVLRQLRGGYTERQMTPFPLSVILCGVRDVRDYRIHVGSGDIITGGSCFNIKAASLRLGNFTQDESQALWLQHTADTGQVFAAPVFARLWEDTRGQPWLVNALADECTWQDRAARDRCVTISLERYCAARERLIQSRATHLDQLTDKLREARVRRVMAPLLAGEALPGTIPEDDREYCIDLGLVARFDQQLQVANPIYREVIPRDLTSVLQDSLQGLAQQAWYLTPEGRLDVPQLLAAFQQFFREHAESWLERYAYKEAGPQLLMQAFLQRIVNGGGRISREYGLGRRRTDLYIEWPLNKASGFNGPLQRVVIELKILRKTWEATVTDGLAQVADYADKCAADEVHLVVFNRDPNISWNDKTIRQQVAFRDKVIDVWGA